MNIHVAHLSSGGFEANIGPELAYYDHHGKSITFEKSGFPLIFSEEAIASADHSECICALRLEAAKNG